MSFKVPVVYLAATSFHKIEISYASALGRKAYASYQPPTCKAFADERIHNTDRFRPQSQLLKLIEVLSKQNGFNPAFTAALIAQESGFNPRTVSVARAIGLTQVTAVADREIAQAQDGEASRWPRYPGLDTLPLPLLKMLVLTGELNAGNEWRLDPQRSIAGGLAYLEILAERWDTPENRRLTDYLYADAEEARTQLILASYHSGYSRVASNLRRRAENWLESDELYAARRYVNRISSFCEQFSNQEEALYEKET